MNAAKILLSDTGLTIRQIAVSTGFQNDAYFSYYFRKKLGVSPQRIPSGALSIMRRRASISPA